MTSKRAAFLLLAVLVLALPAHAAETQPGDSCAGQTDLFRHVGGPENPGTGYMLVCDGTIWKAITTWDSATGKSLFQVNNDAGACSSTKLGRIRYNGTSTWEYCNGSGWISLLSGAAGTPASPDRAIQFNNASAFGGDASFVYTATGNVGIGTGSPSGMFQVTAGSASTIGTVTKGASAQTADFAQWQNSSGTVLTKIDATGSINIYNTGSQGGAYLGFGALSLGVPFGTTNRIDITAGNPTLLAAARGLDFYVSNTPSTGAAARVRWDAAGIVGLNVKGAASQTANLQEWQNNAGTALTVVDATGRVGIGTATPTQKLHIDNGNILVEGTGSFDSGGEEGILYLGDTNHWIKAIHGTGVNIETVLTVHQGGHVILGTGDGGATPVGTILRGPNGTGTDIAGGSLTIQGGLGTGTGATGDIIFKGAPLGSTGTTLQTAATYMTVKGGGATAGNVGIGTTSPSSLLQVAGRVIAGAATTPSSNNTSSPLYLFTTHNGGIRLEPSASTNTTVISDVTDATTRYAHIAYSGASNFLRLSAVNTGSSMVFETAGFNERMRIDSSGNVGIGDTTPDSGTGGQLKLDVAGPAGATKYCDDSGNNCYTPGSSMGTPAAPDRSIQFNNASAFGGASSFVYAATGRLGIGTASPATTLHALSTTEQLRLGYDASHYASLTVNSSGRLTVASDNNGDAGSFNVNGEGSFLELNNGHATLTSNDLASLDLTNSVLLTSNDALTLTVSDKFILSGGNVGIGDTTPDSGTGGQLALDVAGPVGATKYCDDSGNNCYTPGSSMGTPAAPDRSIQFNNASAFGGASTFIYDASGNVGIGTATPTGKLAVIGSAASESTANILTVTGGSRSSSGNSQGISLTAGTAAFLGGNGGSVSISGGNAGGGGGVGGNISLTAGNGAGGQLPGSVTINPGTGTGTPQILLATNGGNVGIGTTTPGATLDVIGDIHYSGVIADVSDRNLKDNIRPLEEGQLQKIVALQGVSFTMKGDDKTELGLIAQDVETIYPELVQASSSGTKSLNYTGLIGPLVEALKEENLRVEKLEARLLALEKTCSTTKPSK